MGKIQTVSPDSVGLSKKRLGKLDAWLEEQVSSERLAGASLLVGRRGRVAYVGTAGVRDVQSGAAFEQDTVVRIYSMTKPIVSVAAMMLYEDGCFQLDHPVADYLPEFGDLQVWQGGDIANVEPAKGPMLVKHLFTHTSGLTYDFMNQNPVDAQYRADGVTSPGTHPDLESWVKAAAKIPLVCEPGSQWNYSISTDVLGRLIEVWSGMALPDFLQQRLFGPLGMTDTGFHVDPENASRFASMYRPKVGPFLGDVAPPPLSERGGLVLQDEGATSRFLEPASVYSGGGGLVSTLHDYSQFCRMLLDGGRTADEQLISPVTYDYMRTNQLPENRDMAAMGQPVWSETSYEGIGFGLGFAVVIDPVKANHITSMGEHHWGGAASTSFWLDPEQDLWVVFLTQLMPSSTYPVRRELRARVYQSIVDSAN